MRHSADARQRQGTKTDLCHPATVAEGQGHARDKIARYLGVGRNRANDHRTGRGRGRGDQPYEWEPGSSDTCVAFSGVVPAGFAAAFRLRVALAVFAASLRFLAEALAFLVAAALTAASLRFFAAALAFLEAAALFAEALRFRVAAALFAAALRSVAFFMARSIAERQQHAGFDAWLRCINAYSKWKGAGEKIGITGMRFSPHTLRHYAACDISGTRSQ